MNGYKTVISNITIDEPLSYPERPFDIDLCEKIYQLPTAFQELALAQRLNTELVTIMASLGKLLRILSEAPSNEEERTFLLTWDPTTHLHQLAGLPSRMKLLKKIVYPSEAIICFALSCFITFLFHLMSTGDLWERKKLNLVLSLSFPMIEDGNDEILDWCRVLALTLCADAKRTRAYTVNRKQLQSWRLFDLEWEEIVSNLRRHFWLPELDEPAKRAWIEARSEA
ncbi:hypothetical protein PV08_10039 [Exophiala spinifera]|uniref:Uncharacterized protein n=1 Tax=Exophiala spinifera TaxID=91928 RepID=A0A0D2AW69_9EURO|nr:uncharacterized protein PV08_10039 [Exophiala spinifera]KIW10740.1 hypothetical protein PV08_10039 [Exophiala spinifera]